MAVVKTPFRYPGAKNKMLPVLMEHIDKMLIGQKHFADVFVGGGSVLLSVAGKYPDIQLYANDKDYWMSCFWSIVSDPDVQRLDRLLVLLDIIPTIDQFRQLNETLTNDPVECAFRSLFFNRTCFSGIVMKDDQGYVKSNPIGGKNQNSKWKINCRYNAKKLIEKVRHCHQLLAGRTTVGCKDFAEYDVLTQSDYPAYCDPPYFQKGSMLYSENMNAFEHQKLAQILEKRNNWMLSYDDCPEICNLYQNSKILDHSMRYSINGKKTNWTNKNELIILSGNVS
jgi:DNA adenine methylase